MTTTKGYDIVFFDFDSTVVTKESLDEVIALALSEHPDRDKLVAEIEAITNLGMAGELAFTESVRRRIAVAPLTLEHFEAVGQMLLEHVTPGMKEVFAYLHEEGIPVCIISGGFFESILPVATELAVSPADVFTNQALFDEMGNLHGVDESSLLWTDAGKTQAIQAVTSGRNMSSAVLVGDGANDLAAYKTGAVDTFIGFGGNVTREPVKAAAPHWAASANELLEQLKHLQ